MGRNYFEMSMKYTNELMKLLELLTEKVQGIADEDIHKANMSQIWALVLLVFVMILSPMLLLLAKNANNAVIVSEISKALVRSKILAALAPSLKTCARSHFQFFQDLVLALKTFLSASQFCVHFMILESFQLTLI